MNKKRWMGLIVIFLLCLTTISPMVVKGENSQKIKVGYMPNFSTINEPVIKGEEGYGYDYLMKVSKYTGWQYEFVSCEWEEGLELLARGEIDIFGPNQLYENYEKDYNFVQTEHNLGMMNTVILADTSEDISYNDYATLNGKKIGVIEDTVYEKLLQKYWLENDFEMEIVYLNEDEVVTPNLSEKYDYLLTGGQNIISNTKVVARVGAIPITYLLREEDKILLHDLEKALDQITDSDFTLPYKLYTKYYENRDYAYPLLTEKEAEAIVKQKALKVGYGVDYPPMQYRNEVGKAAGISVDIMTYLAESAGIEVEFVPLYRGIEYDKDDYDAILTFTESELVSGHAKQSVPYTQRGLMMIGRNRSEIVEGENIIGLCDYSSVNVDEISFQLPNYTTKIYNNFSELSKALSEGEITHMVAISFNIDSAATEFGTKNYSIYNISQDITFYINYSDNINEYFVSAMDKIITSLDDTTKDLIYIENTQKLVKHASFKDYIKENILTVVIGISILILLIVFMFMKNIKKHAKEIKSILETNAQLEISSLYKFKIDASKVLEKAKEDEYVIISIDIDNFKYINENYGFDYGNKILKSLIKVIKSEMKSGDILGHSFADEFLILKRNNKELNVKSSIKAELYKFRRILSQEEINQLKQITVSVGVYVIKNPSMDIATMLGFASIARKSVKAKYGNTLAIYDEVHAKQKIRLDMLKSYEAALDNGEFQVYLQPQYHANTKKISGAELLVRWIKDGEVKYDPYDFIPVFEDAGIIAGLDTYLREQMCIAMKRWMDNGYEECPISVNVSRVELLQEDFVARLIKCVDQYFIKHALFKIEITETAYAQDNKMLKKVIEELQSNGFTVEMDDFGSGYSSLNVLKDIPVDLVKLDMKFVESGENAMRSGNILSSVIRMAQGINLETIAEGVETKEQYEYLKSMGCDYIQGYYFARPMPLARFEKLLKESELHKDSSVQDKEESKISFLDATAQESLIFNTFLGGAAIVEYREGEVYTVRANDKFYDAFGIGVTKAEVFGIDLLARLDEQQRKIVGEDFQLSCDTGEEVSGEISVMIKQALVWQSYSLKRLCKNGNAYLLYLCLTNITSRKEMEKRLQIEMQKSNQLIESMPGGYGRFELTKDTVKTVDISDSLCKLLEYSKEELMNMDINSLIYPYDMDLVIESQKAILDGEQGKVLTYRYLAKSGKILWFNCSGYFKKTGENTGILEGYFYDITELKELENEKKWTGFF